jgi:hypothetical protein
MYIDKEDLPEDLQDLMGESIRPCGGRYRLPVVAFEIALDGKLLSLETLDETAGTWRARVTWYPDATGNLVETKTRWEG